LVGALVFSQSGPAFVNLVKLSLAFHGYQDNTELFTRLTDNLSSTPAVRKLHLENIISLVDLANIHSHLSHLEGFLHAEL
jgi:hypothetical protein